MNGHHDMNERVHRYLDGDLPLSALSPDEVAQARQFERAVDALQAEGEVFGELDVAPGVMNAIAVERNAAEAESPGPGGFSTWLFDKHRISFTLRPVYVAAAAALVLAAGLQWDLVPWRGGGASTASVEAEPAVFVRFEISAPDARSVELAGSFSNWAPEISLVRVEGGRWIAFVPLRPGVHDYAFRVDGERWVVDPSAPRVADGFGGFNSRLSLLLADS